MDAKASPLDMPFGSLRRSRFLFERAREANENSCTWLASRGFFLASLLACTKSFASLVFRVVGLFTRNARDVNEFVHAKRLARKKPLLAR